MCRSVEFFLRNKCSRFVVLKPIRLITDDIIIDDIMVTNEVGRWCVEFKLV